MEKEKELPANAYKVINDDDTETWVHFEPIVPGHIQNFVRAEIAASRPYQPVLAICLDSSASDAMIHKIVAANENESIKNSGWVFVVLLGFETSHIRAFGVPESELETFEELKKLLEDQIKQNGK